MKLDFNQEWRVYPTPEPEEWNRPRTYEIVNLPHDYNISLETQKERSTGPAGGYYPGCSVEYEKDLSIPDEWKNKLLFLEFDGVYHNAVLWINGKFAARHPNGYTPFWREITEFVKPGENHIRVSAANEDIPNSRWYTGTGIYRDVHLWVKNPLYIPLRGVILTAKAAEGQAEVNCRVTVANKTEEPVQAVLKVRLTDPDGNRSVTSEIISIQAQRCQNVELRVPVSQPRLWSDETPNLYQAAVELFYKNEMVDQVLSKYGLRTIEITPQKGFLLNGKPIKLRGGCLHHVGGIMGAASYPKAEERRIRLLKECGYNAIRSSHNPASEALLNACDKLGMLVIDEAFDMWRVPKRPYDYSRYFDDWWPKDVKAMVERDRNHPCVIMYSTGNEIPERDGRSGGYQLSREITDCFKRNDPTRPVTNALCNASPDADVEGMDANLLKNADQIYFARATEAFAAPLDVTGYNYMPERFEMDHAYFPNKVFCATETAPADSCHGWSLVERFPFLIGDFVWTAMDYIGEAGIGRTLVDEPLEGLAEYPNRLAGTGDLDLCGRKRPRSYYRDCVWGIAKRPYLAVEPPCLYGKKQNTTMWGWPVVEEYWNYPGMEGKPVKVSVYSMAAETALYLNGKLIGVQPSGKLNHFIASFQLPYQPGELTAVNLEDGKEICRHTIRTPGLPAHIRLTAEKPFVNRGEEDILFIHAELIDKAGNVILDGDDPVHFSVEGGGSFLAAGNAAVKTTTNYTSPDQRLCRGYAQAVIRTNGLLKPVTVRCAGERLPESKIVLPLV